MIFLAVFLISLSALTFEVLLTRVFSICQWNHLSFMVISIALFGFAASGTFLSLLETRKKHWSKQLAGTGPVKIFAICYTLTAISSFLILNQIPLDYFRLPLEPIQTLYLLAAYITLSLPFFFSGLIIALAYAFWPDRTALIYLAGMGGSALGAVIPVPLLPFLGEGKLIILSALIPLLILPCGKRKLNRKFSPNPKIILLKRICPWLISFVIVWISTVFIFSSDFRVEIKSSPYKALSQILQFPNTEITETHNSLWGRIDKVKSDYIRFAPGLSMKFPGNIPVQSAIFKDGDAPFVLYNFSDSADPTFSRFTLPYAGYLLTPQPEHVLIIQHGGGTGIACALSANAQKITIVESNLQVAKITQKHYKWPVINQNPRVFLAQSAKRFQVIHIDNWGSSIPGAAALNQEYLLTIDAFKEYISHLTEDGILMISRKLLLPPSDALRLWATAYESLISIGLKKPENHIRIIRNWDIYTLIVSFHPFQDDSVIKNFARSNNFDWVYYPDATPDQVNRFNVFDQPYHYQEISRLLNAYQTGNSKTFFNNYLLDVNPQTDGRPFPSRFLKWSRIKDIYKSTGSRLYSLVMSGEIVIAVVFVEAILISTILILLPLFAFAKGSEKIPASHILYFFAVGVGFMFVEIFFIKFYTLLFGDPVISFTIVLASLLIFSAAGGYFSHFIGRRGLRYALIALIVTLIFVFYRIDILIYSILGFTVILRYFIAIGILFPIGFLLGVPFPLGMRYFLKNPVERSYAWAINGCASVLTSIISAQLALCFGISTLAGFATGAYIMVFCSTGKLVKT
ncbi:MAG: hypothetical protein JW786_12585 [Desulfobacterales bacterium]|nr:hypothetical protein [Desulfobacterales bacterium]